MAARRSYRPLRAREGRERDSCAGDDTRRRWNMAHGMRNFLKTGARWRDSIKKHLKIGIFSTFRGVFDRRFLIIG